MTPPDRSRQRSHPPSRWDTGDGKISVVLVLLFALGLALTAIALLLISGAPSTGNRVVAGLVGAMAGGLIGASTSIFINSRFEQPVLDQVFELLDRTADCRVTCPDDDLRDLRRVWHHYHLTLVDHQPVWQYSRVPFDNHAAVGSLTNDVPIVDPAGDGLLHTYKVDAAVWNKRFILVQTRVQGEEAAMVEIFPEISGFRRIHAGIAVIQSWSNNDALVPAIISDSEIVTSGSDGAVTAHGDVEKLEAIWREHFDRVALLLPAEDRASTAP